MLQYIPEYYEFQNSAKLLSGERALEHIPYELSVRGCKRPMLLSDRVLEKFGAVATVTDAMYQGEVTPAACFLDIPADSAVEVVNEAARQFRAAGGGPVPRPGLRQPGGCGRRFGAGYGQGRVHAGQPWGGRSDGAYGL